MIRWRTSRSSNTGGSGGTVDAETVKQAVLDALTEYPLQPASVPANAIVDENGHYVFDSLGGFVEHE